MWSGLGGGRVNERRHGAKEALLVAWCIALRRAQHLLHLAVGNKESQVCWTEFFRDAPTLDSARVAADRFSNTFAREYPAAVACFTDDLEALLAIHRVPVRHRIRVRTTNLAERSFTEERRRTKVIPRLMDEKAAMKLVFAR